MNSSPRRIGILLWIVNLSSIAASVFTYVYLSYFVYLRTGSVMLSEAVLLAPMVIPVVLCLAINHFAGAVSPRSLLVGFNAAGIVTALLSYAMIDRHIGAAIAGALVIGFIDAVQRVARTVAIKRYFSSADVKYALPITLTAQFIAGGVAGVGLSFYKAQITPEVAGLIVTGAFALAALASWWLPRTANATPTAAPQAAERAGHALRQIARLLKGNGDLRRRFYAFLIVVSVFQGFFTVSRVTLPTHVLNLSQAFVGYLQIVSAMAALAAALLYFWLGKREVGIGKVGSVVLSGVSLLAMVAATTSPDVPVAYGLYFIYMFVWEILFFKYQSEVVVVTPSDQMALVATFQYAGVYLGMLVCALLGGLITQHASLTTAALAFALVYVVLMALNAARHKPAGQGETRAA